MMLFSAQLAEAGGAPSPLHSLDLPRPLQPLPSQTRNKKLPVLSLIAHLHSLQPRPIRAIPLAFGLIGAPSSPRGLYSRENRGLALGQLYKPQAGSWVNQNKHFKLYALHLFFQQKKH